MLSKEEQNELIAKYYDSILDYCMRRLSSRDAAEEVTQDTFLLMIEKAANLTNDFLKYWLTKVAENKCNAYLRRVKRENRHVHLDGLDVEASVLLSNKVSDCSFGAYYETYMAAMLNHLSPKEAYLCELRFIKGYSPERIAEILQIKESAVNTRVSRLKRKIEKIIREEIPFL